MNTDNASSRVGPLWTKTTRPPHTQSVGSIVCVHGGPGGDHRGNGFVFDEIAEDAALLGFTTVQFDLFGNGQSEGSAPDMSLSSQCDDVRRILEHVQNTYHPSIHLIGESMGCTPIAMLWPSVATSYVLLWPAFDLRDTDLRAYLTPEWQEYVSKHGQLQDDGMIVGQRLYEEIRETDFSALFAIPDQPSLIVHGRKDEEVPFQQSCRATESGKGYVRLHLHADAGHGFQHPAHRRLVRRWVGEWLNAYK